MLGTEYELAMQQRDEEFYGFIIPQQDLDMMVAYAEDEDENVPLIARLIIKRLVAAMENRGKNVR